MLFLFGINFYWLSCMGLRHTLLDLPKVMKDSGKSSSVFSFPIARFNPREQYSAVMPENPCHLVSQA